jgi:tungstate transport system ATP-binding protein
MNASSVILALNAADVRRGGVRVLDVQRLCLHQGEVLCLVGPNGSGKTTLLLTLSCLLERASGELLFKGRAVEGRASVLSFRRNTATVFQEPLLFDTTVYDNVASGLKLRDVPQRELNRRVEESLERFRIGHLARRAARKLSGGEAQRTSIARALANNPEILFLDEPFSALDPPTREALIDDLEQVIRDTGIAVVMSTHDQAEALRLADTMAVIHQGMIAQAGPPEQIINFPTDAFVASFVGMGTVLRGRVVDIGPDMLRVAVGDTVIECVGDIDAGRQVVLCIRPENVTLAVPGAQDADSARNHFSGTITRIIPMGHFLKVQLDCGFFLSTHITHHSRAALGLAEGAPVIASFKATAVHLIPHV